MVKGLQTKLSIHKVVFLFVCILNMGGVASVFLPFNILDIFIIIYSLFLIKKIRGSFIKGPIFSGIIFLYLFFVVSAVITSSSIINYKGFFLRIFSAYLVICAFKGDTDDIRTHLVKVFRIVAFLALINVVLYTLFPQLFIYIETDGYNTYTLGLIFNYLPTSKVFGLFDRNPGLFWEPGVLQMSMNMLIFNDMIVEKRGFQKVVVPIISLITTASTTGLGLFALIIAYRILFVHNASSSKSIRQILLLLVFLPLFIPIIHQNANDKFGGEGSISTAYRLNDLLLSGEIAKQHPFIGIGFDENKYKQMSNNISLNTYENYEIGLDRGNSNSLSQVIIYFGLPAFLLFLLALYKQKIFPHKKFFFFLFLISIASEPLLVTTMMMTFLFSSLLKDTHRSNKALQINQNIEERNL